MDRRRRVLLDASTAEQAEGTRKNNSVSQTGELGGKKGAGYSQDVRQACGTRLVQLIPVRRRSFIALIVASIAITASLLTAHYLVYVNGWLPWYGHPLAVALDATHPQSIAAWLGSHLWLLCLGATILTFQLRRHKLDDYNGEYRLWFWLVFTCVIASIDSTTHITELFGHSLDRWSRANIGWSGQAVVLATLATLVGMLGLRLCTELKTVPTSLICWLIGLASWAGSATLAQEMFRVDIAIQTRIWLRAGLWLIGLTSIWIAAVAYLRHVYMEAQRRFLARGLLARRAAGATLTERVRQTIPFMRTRQEGDAEALEAGTEASRWSLKRMFRRKPKDDEGTAETSKADRKSKAKPTSAAKPLETSKPQEMPRPQTVETQRTDQTVRPQPAAPLAAQNRPQVASANAPIASGGSTQATTGTSATASKTPSKPTTSTASTEAPKKSGLWPFKFKLWPGKEVGEEDAPEYQKLLKEEKAAERKRLQEERQLQKENARAEKAAAKQARTAQRDAEKSAKREAQQKQNSDGTAKKKGGIGKTLLKPVAAVGSVLKKIKLPSLSALKLNPPEADTDATTSKPSTLKPVSQEKPLPSTSAKPGTGPQLSQRNVQNQQDDDEDDEDDRNMSRADRKKLRKQNRAA
jgi:hypothetical protein